MSRFGFAAVIFSLTLLCTAIGLFRLDIDTDVVRSLPSDDPIIASGLTVFENHPIQDHIAVDIMYEGDNPDVLAAACDLLEEQFLASGLFSQIGSSSYGELIPGLARYAAEHLPLLFSGQELQQKLVPLLDDRAIEKRIAQLHRELASMEGVGQARFVTLDPLGLKDLVMARLMPLAPVQNVQVYKGRLLSADRRHMLVTAKPHAGGTDTENARKLTQVIIQAEQKIQNQYGGTEKEIHLTPVGAFRAALDNEQIIRRDVRLALVLVTGGIGLLLLVSFPRPLVGLLSLVPAFAGLGFALFVYSFFSDSISIMVLGFGSAIVSITVDHGVTYLLFLDRRRKTNGLQASSEVRCVGIMAVITSIGAFLILSWSGFPIFAELGRFTALGIFFSYLFVHGIFPKLFPTLSASTRTSLPLRSFVDLLSRTGKTGCILAAVLALGFLFIAKPRFHVSLDTMNTVSDATIAADALFTSVWGGIDKRIYLMDSAPTVVELQEKNDRLLKKIEHDIQNNILQSVFVPSMLFPGQLRGRQNMEAWKGFWSTERREQVSASLRSAALANGFKANAFTPFISLLGPDIAMEPQAIPAQYYDMFGIAVHDSGLIQHIGMRPGQKYEGGLFFSRYTQEGSIFDADLFTTHLADVLFSTFTLLFVVIACSLALLLFVFYLDLRLTLLTLLPPAFAYICTLGTLSLLGRPLDIPSLMLSIVILGMGIDYSIFCVRAHQRYRSPSHPSYALVHLAVFIAGTSTLIGFGVLCLAEHTLLKSIGITSLLGIAYSLIGTFFLLPPLLTRYLDADFVPGRDDTNDKHTRICHRYRTLEAYPRMFARLKLRFDPLFIDLERLLPSQERVQRIVDIGCGYGVPACWCLEHFPQSRVYGIDPDPERVRVATFAFHGRGQAIKGAAPELPAEASEADLVLLLDMLHYLDEKTLITLLSNCQKTLSQGGRLLTRFVIQPEGKPSFSWFLEDFRIKLGKGQPVYRSQEEVAALMEGTGFTVIVNKRSATNSELAWLACVKEEL